MKPIIIDNYLDKKSFTLLQSTMMGRYFPWVYVEGILNNRNTEQNYCAVKKIQCDEKYDYQFVHNFYSDYEFADKEYSYILEPLINKLDPLSLVRIKANLLPRTENIIEHGFHIDRKNEHCKAAIYYINSNNGYTMFFDNTKVNSVENRLVKFNACDLHTGSTCTDKQVRVVLNFNYF
jgi:hypothetical protein